MTTMLIVDDHPAFRLELRRLLVSEGYTVVGEAGDGRTAISMATLERPDVVLLDIGLPDIDGFAVAEQVAGARPPIPVILISSRDASMYGSRIQGSNVLGFLRKDDLTGATIRELLSRPAA